jgi:LysR family hydrogen peroxide-inducible transcriptional activator
MRYFEALASVLHFGRAAELVHVSQPALSSQIREMEAFLGVTLVERNRGNILLTRKGEEVLEHVRGVLAGVERLEQAVRRGGGLLDGPVRFGIIPTVAPYLVPKLVPHLRSAYPAIEVELKEAVTDRLIADLAEGRLDVVVAALPIDHDGIATNDSDVLMSPLTEAQVDTGRLLLLEEGHCLRDQALAVCGMAGRRSLVNFGATSMATLLQMVSHGMGMTLIPEIAVTAETARNDIRIVPFAEPQPSREIGLAWRRNGAGEDEIEALAQAVGACVAA